MGPVREGFFAKLSGIGQVVGVIVAIVGVAITWHQVHGGIKVMEDPRPATTPQADLKVSIPQSPTSPSKGRVGAARPEERNPGESFTHSRPSEPVIPTELTLRDGEQATLLGDQASVAVEFSQVGSENIVTLRVNTPDEESVPHVVLGAGARYPFRAAGHDYWIYILSVDNAGHTVVVRISQNLGSNTKGDR